MMENRRTKKYKWIPVCSEVLVRGICGVRLEKEKEGYGWKDLQLALDKSFSLTE